MYKICSVLLVATLISACGRSADDYNADLKRTVDTMAVHTYHSAVVIDGYSEVWSDAIENREAKYGMDANNKFGKIAEGKDFNVELAKKKAENEEQGIIANLDRGRQFVDSAMKTLNDDIPEKSAEGKRKVMELYGVYTQIHGMAKSPDGSLISFRNQASKLTDDAVRLVNELRVMGLASDNSTSSK